MIPNSNTVIPYSYNRAAYDFSSAFAIHPLDGRVVAQEPLSHSSAAVIIVTLKVLLCSLLIIEHEVHILFELYLTFVKSFKLIQIFSNHENLKHRK